MGQTHGIAAQLINSTAISRRHSPLILLERRGQTRERRSSLEQGVEGTATMPNSVSLWTLHPPLFLALPQHWTVVFVLEIHERGSEIEIRREREGLPYKITALRKRCHNTERGGCVGDLRGPERQGKSYIKAIQWSKERHDAQRQLINTPLFTVPHTASAPGGVVVCLFTYNMCWRVLLKVRKCVKKKKCYSHFMRILAMSVLFDHYFFFTSFTNFAFVNYYLFYFCFLLFYLLPNHSYFFFILPFNNIL